jgi:hypothetical protein
VQNKNRRKSAVALEPEPSVTLLDTLRAAPRSCSANLNSFISSDSLEISINYYLQLSRSAKLASLEI